MKVVTRVVVGVVVIFDEFDCARHDGRAIT